MLQATNIAVITPTKGRHKLLAAMLESLATQQPPPGQIIIADGGRDSQELVSGFSDKLNVEWLDCPEPGQIVQRNLALTRLQSNIKAIIYLDDDIVLEPDALAKLIDFWNSRSPEPAGISFNIVNAPVQRNSFLRKLFCMQIEPKGRVLQSGYNTPITRLAENLKSEWLLGGATAWRRDILKEHTHPGVASRWAICEDLIFSYPVGKQYDLYVCADAIVRDIDTPAKPPFAASRYRGRNTVLWRHYFVCNHEELSKVSFFWMSMGQTMLRLGSAFTGKSDQLALAIGTIEGLLKCLVSKMTSKNPRDILE